MIEKVEPAYFKGADEFTNALLAVLENIVGNNKVLLNSSLSIIRYVLPALLKKFRSNANDAKMMSLKIFTDIFTVFLNDESIFDVDHLQSTQTDKKQMTSFLINDMIVNSLLPQWSILLEEAEPVALYALKLLSFITTKSRVYSEICD